MYPEVGGNEKHTSLYCKKVLKPLGFKVKNVFEYGFIADLKVPGAKKTIAFRADMDALPIEENNAHSYVSKNKHVAHICGHDAHMAILLLLAKLLTQNISALKVNVRLVFQPCEEQYPGGARGMIAGGALKNVSEIYGLHMASLLPVKTIATRVGPFFASSDEFEVIIQGKSCHAAHPEYGLNPLFAATTVLTEWQKMLPHIPAKLPIILTPTICQGGTATNVIPETIKIAGTMRTFDQALRKKILELMRKSLQKLSRFGYKYKIKIFPGYDSLVNSKAGVARIISAAKDILPAASINTKFKPVRYAEDYSYYLQKVPGAFFLLGCGNKRKKITAPLHAVNFNIDEDAISYGAAIMLNLALKVKS